VTCIMMSGLPRVISHSPMSQFFQDGAGRQAGYAWR
jgi:hypothetical protein